MRDELKLTNLALSFDKESVKINGDNSSKINLSAGNMSKSIKKDAS